MATTTASVPCDNSTLANFQAWVAAIWDAFTTLGWMQTSDTGQSANPPTAVPSNAYVYQIFKAADALASSSPIYAKVECGFNSTTIDIRFTVGTGSNGSGTITGPVIGPLEITGNIANRGAGNLNCYFSGDAGDFRAMLWQNDAAACTAVGIERSRDTSGNATSSYVTFLSATAANYDGGWHQQSMLPDGTVGAPYAYQNEIAPSAVSAPITYSITSGGLPPGLSLISPDSSREWRVSGTPTTAGSYTFTLKALNADGSDSQSLTIVIDAGSGEEAAYGFAG